MSHGPFGPESIVVFRFVAPRWLAAYQFPFQLLLSASPLPGHTTPAPDPLAIATPAHWPSRAASRCTAKLPAESLALVSRGCSPCSSSPYSALPDISATASGRRPDCRSSALRKILDMVQASWEILETESCLQTGPAGLLSALRPRSAPSPVATDRLALCSCLVRFALLAKSRSVPWCFVSALGRPLDPGSVAAPASVHFQATHSACLCLAPLVPRSPVRWPGSGSLLRVTGRPAGEFPSAALFRQHR